MNNAITITNLKKTYPNFKIDNISLSIKEGTITGLIGENGAGKTTLIKAILNIINKDDGVIKIFNKDHQEFESLVKDDIAVVLDNTFFPELLSPKDINCIMKDIYSKWDQTLYFKYLKQFNLPPKQMIKTFSKGMRKKLEIITALSSCPRLLILDEPTSGLDPVVRSEILDIFQEFLVDEKNTILFSSHITSDLEHIADYIIFLNEGQVLLNEQKDDILENYAILKCDAKYFGKIDHSDFISYKKNKYEYQVLLSNKKKALKKYQGAVIDKVTLEELMILLIKGVRV